eukprot:900502-Pleurochrysis_carterae.AAC.3
MRAATPRTQHAQRAQRALRALRAAPSAPASSMSATAKGRPLPTTQQPVAILPSDAAIAASIGNGLVISPVECSTKSSRRQTCTSQPPGSARKISPVAQSRPRSTSEAYERNASDAKSADALLSVR